MPPKFAALFTHNNYRFSTTEKGRLTSLYFEDAHGNQGRWRREHPHGAALFFQGKSLRFFVKAAEIGNFIQMAETVAEDEVNEDEIEDDSWRNCSLHKDLWMDIRDGLPSWGNNYRGSPRDGFHVVELCPPLYYARHCSSGSVILRDATEFDAYDKLKTFDGELTDWTS